MILFCELFISAGVSSLGSKNWEYSGLEYDMGVPSGKIPTKLAISWN
jgi:hypothetical protein